MSPEGLSWRAAQQPAGGTRGCAWGRLGGSTAGGGPETLARPPHGGTRARTGAGRSVHPSSLTATHNPLGASVGERSSEPQTRASTWDTRPGPTRRTKGRTCPPRGPGSVPKTRTARHPRVRRRHFGTVPTQENESPGKTGFTSGTQLCEPGRDAPSEKQRAPRLLCGVQSGGISPRNAKRPPAPQGAPMNKGAGRHALSGAPTRTPHGQRVPCSLCRVPRATSRGRATRPFAPPAAPCTSANQSDLTR